MTTLSSRDATTPTMVDVARRAHVSVKTVSRVVNAEPGVRDSTASRVRHVIDELGFQRNDGASSLRRGRTSSVAVVVEDLANPFYSQLTAAVEREARSRDCVLISSSAEGSSDREASILAGMVSRRVDGVVLVPSGGGSPGATARAAARVPLVLVDRPLDGVEVDTVLGDNAGGVRSAVDHLAAHRHRAIGFLGDDASYWTARQRRAAFEEAHASLALPGDPRVAMGPHTTGSVAAALERWRRGPDPVTAVVTGNNRVTVALLRVLRTTGAALSLVGYDDFELADLVEPAVTVVHQDPEAMGRRAAQLLFARIAGDDSPATRTVVPTRLVVRSSGPFPEVLP